MMNPVPARASRRVRRGRLVLAVVAVSACAVTVSLAPHAVERVLGGDPDPSTVRLAPVRPVRPGPANQIQWWTPVRGEPLGIAVDGTDVAAAALDEVRLLDGTDGSTRWKARFTGIRRYRPAIAGDRIAATSEAELALFDRSDGRRIATVPFDGPGPCAFLPGPSGPLAVAGSESGALLAVDAASGASRWSVQYPGSVTIAPKSQGGVAIASWHRDDGATVRALDLADGSLRWQVDLGPVSGAVGVGAGLVFVVGGAGVHSAVVRGLDPTTGGATWTTPLPGWFDDELDPAVDGSTVYLVDGIGTVFALDAATGALRWRQETGRTVTDRGVVVTGGAVVFPSYDDELVVLDRATGRLRSARVQRGVPVDLAAAPDGLVVALRLAAPSRIEAHPEP